jgi:hypothetical protein
VWLYHTVAHTVVKPSTNWIWQSLREPNLKNAVSFQNNRLGAERLFTKTSFSLATDRLPCDLPRVPHFGGKSPMLPTAHERCCKIGTQGKDGSNPLIFDGRPESWPPAASAKAAKSTVTSGKGTVSTNVADYQKKDLRRSQTRR